METSYSCGDCKSFKPGLGPVGYCTEKQEHINFKITACDEFESKWGVQGNTVFTIENGKWGAYIACDGVAMTLDDIVALLSVLYNELVKATKEVEE